MNPPLRIAVADDEADMRDFVERILPQAATNNSHFAVCNGLPKSAT